MKKIYLKEWQQNNRKNETAVKLEAAAENINNKPIQQRQLPWDEFDVQGSCWGHDLRQLKEDQQIFARKFINDILFAGNEGTLHRYSVKINEPETPTRMVAPTPNALFYVNTSVPGVILYLNQMHPLARKSPNIGNDNSLTAASYFSNYSE